MKLKLLINPFERIAGLKALYIGLAGIVLSTVAAVPIDFHYHGLLHFGPASNHVFWVYLVERLVVWLIPAILFYVGGLFMSNSKIRLIDVFGTVAFAQVPLFLLTLFNYTPPMRLIHTLDYNRPIMEIAETPGLMGAALISMLGMIFLVFTLIWMFHALRVSCNLKAGRLWFVYLVGVIGGEILCRYLIQLMY